MVVFCHHAHRQQLQQKERERGEHVKPPSAPASIMNIRYLETHITLFALTPQDLKSKR